MNRLRRLTIVTVLFAVLLASPLRAKLCGDDVDGQDVPCDCGDTVVSSVVLNDDPVTARECPSDGLIVRSTRSDGPIVVDLAGQTLRGSASGAGVWLVAGSGASLIGGPGASITGFRDGILASGVGAVSLIRDIVVRNNQRDGVRVNGTGYRIEQVESYSSGRDGFSLAGRDFVVVGSQAVSSGRFGFLVTGQKGVLGTSREMNRASLSVTTGFNILGSGHRLVECEALHNGRDGVALSGVQHEVISCRTENNLGSGITGTGSGWLLRTNTARANRNHGLLVRGVGLIDGGGNRGAENRGELSQRAAVQCEIGGTPCQ